MPKIGDSSFDVFEEDSVEDIAKDKYKSIAYRFSENRKRKFNPGESILYPSESKESWQQGCCRKDCCAAKELSISIIGLSVEELVADLIFCLQGLQVYLNHLSLEAF